MDNMSTTFSAKCEILSELWIKYRDEETLEDFFEYNDLSLPLAFLISEEIVTDKNSAIEGFIDEAFILLLGAVGIEDKGFDSLDDILVNYFEE
jgi:hypothetical protein